MKAVLCKEYGLPEKLVLEEIDSLKPGDGEIVVSVKACGVNFPDTLIIQGKYQFKPEFPFSPGGEVAGIVKELGPNVENIKVGDRVIAFNTWGGFAEEILVEANRTIEIPDEMDFIHAAGFVLTYGTSIHALKDRAEIQPGESLLILGASGGVGLSAIQLGKVMGAKVIAAASSDKKLAICRENGADELINYTNEDLRERVKQITNKKGVDVIYDPVGGRFSELAIRDMAWKGRYLVIGFAIGEIPKIPLNLALLKGCSIVGVFWGQFTQREMKKNQDNNQELMQMFVDRKVKPHIHATFPLEKAVDALNEVLLKKVSGKVILTT